MMLEQKTLTSPVKRNGPERLSGWADDPPKHTQSKKLTKAIQQDPKDDIPPVSETASHTVESSLTREQSLKRENVNRAAAFKELNANSTSKLFLEGVNLRLLVKNLVPESQLQEPDIPWSWDVLFAEMVSDLTETLKDNNHPS